MTCWGSNIESKIVVILGISMVIADAFAMAVGDYLGTKAEKDYSIAERKREEWVKKKLFFCNIFINLLKSFHRKLKITLKEKNKKCSNYIKLKV
jgi:flagellar basal body-associated protein FliL